MTAPSARLRASQQLRETAMATVTNDPEGMSAVLLSELATLLAATTIGRPALREWWSSYCTVLTPEHQDEARAALVACGVSDAGVPT